jgi:hypothetical protein
MLFVREAVEMTPENVSIWQPGDEQLPRDRNECERWRTCKRLSFKSLIILLMCLCLPLLGCANSERVENRDYAFDSYYPTPNEIQLAQKRAQRYWKKNSQRFKYATRYLAVYTTSVVQGDVNQDLNSKLMKSETTASFFETDSSLDASCIMIYDTATNTFVSNLGYASVDLPPRGSVARWDGYTARYIGWGG